MKLDDVKQKSTLKPKNSTTTACLPLNGNGEYKKKSCTTLLCELTRLKSQQKYLECSQIKLNADNFMDAVADGILVDNANTSNNNGVTQLINEIEHSKMQIEQDLRIYREDAHRNVQDMWVFVNAIKSDVLQPERLRQFTVPAIRERIIGINTQLERLSARNANELRKLQKECEQIEKNNKILIKF